MTDEPRREPPTADSSRLMTRFRSRDTAPELRLRRLLHGQGMRYRVHFPVPGMPRRSIDIAFPRRRVAVFVDGCYWHGCPEHGKRPSVNAEWWDWKIERNIARDKETMRILERSGWKAIRIWEHEPVYAAAAQVQAALSDSP